VYSGGGVEPDKYLAGLPSSIDGIGFSPTPFGRTLYARQLFENYAVKYMAVGDARIAQVPTGRVTIARNFTVDDAMVADFREFLKAERIRVDDDAFTKDLAFIKAMLRYRIDEAVFGFVDAQKHFVGADPQAQLGMSMFSEAQKLLVLGRPGSRAAN
jgi:carboxyl-terminal processing protease